jgi:hypothetical protein
MNIAEYVKEKKDNLVRQIKWNFHYGSLWTIPFYPFWWIMRRDRGTEFPFYFPEEAEFIKHNLGITYGLIDDFIHGHEPERSQGDHNQTLVHRFKYVMSNFHYYSNDTLANLYFSTKLPLRDYQRIKSTYNNYYLGFLAYNTFSSMFLIALTNYFFRAKKTTIPVVLLASATAFAGFAINYKLSYNFMDYLFAHNVRRLGYDQYVHRYSRHYPRDIEYIRLN